MSKIRALSFQDFNSQSGDDSCDTTEGQPTREAQEEEVISKYNRSLALVAQFELAQAAILLEDILKCPFIIDTKNDTPLQLQIKLGCYKNLGRIYSDDSCLDLESARDALFEAVSIDRDDFNSWFRLGHADIKAIDYYAAVDSFSEAFRCSPRNWGCIENLVTLHYVIHEYIGCLRFCAIGLDLDRGFTRGLVFRDHIFKLQPRLSDPVLLASHFDNSEYLSVQFDYDSKWKEQFLEEARLLVERLTRKIVTEREILQKKADNEIYPPSVPLSRKDLRWVPFCRAMLAYYKHIKNLGRLLRPIDLSGCLLSQDTDSVEIMDVDETPPKAVMDDLSTTNASFSGEQDSTLCDNNMENGVEENETELQSETQDNELKETPSKKKPRRDVKWWQMEGKRRSQRVRGHVTTSSQVKSKTESSFGDSLRHIIPPSLLCGENEGKEREPRRSTDPLTTDTCVDAYFGSDSETNDVKRIVTEFGTRNIVIVVVEIVKFLSLKCTFRWPTELVHEYLKLYDFYRTNVTKTDSPHWGPVEKEEINALHDELSIDLTMLELRLEKDREDFTETDRTLDNDVASHLVRIEQIIHSRCVPNVDISLRFNWLMAKLSVGRYDDTTSEIEDTLGYLRNVQKILTDNPGLSVKIATRRDNCINIQEAERKMDATVRMENKFRVIDLFEAKDYDALIEVLNFCLSLDDKGSDETHRYYLAVAYFETGSVQRSVDQCCKTIKKNIKESSQQVLSLCVDLIEKILKKCSDQLTLNDKQIITEALLKLMIWVEKTSSANETLQTTPWCLLHSILYTLEETEPAFYLEEESVPNSVLLLHLAHESLGRSSKCTMNQGKFLQYTIDSIFSVRDSEHYAPFEETKYCIEQAIFCFHSHPSKKTRYLVDHGTSRNQLSWEESSRLYLYFKPEELPEFDSYSSIGAEVEGLYQRILSLMPPEFKPTDLFNDMKAFIESKGDFQDFPKHSCDFPTDFKDIYFLIADRQFKAKEWIDSVTNYIYDLCINPDRFDSWAAIALANAEIINSRMNTSQKLTIDQVVCDANAVVKCFQRSLHLQKDNMKLLIEFGGFVYAMHSFCSRYLKHEQSEISLDDFHQIEKQKEMYLLEAAQCFEPVVKSYDSLQDVSAGDSRTQHEENWIHHYMMGKIFEKLQPDNPEAYLKQYQLAAELIHGQGAPYPVKINYYNYPELAIEALEIYYRIHASVLSYIDKHDYVESTETVLMKFIESAAESPFMKMKGSRGGDGEARKKRQDDLIKKEVQELLNDVIKEVEEQLSVVEFEPSVPHNACTALEENSSGTSTENSNPPKEVLKDFSLSAFRAIMREKDLRLSQRDTSKAGKSPTVSTEKPKALSRQNSVVTEIVYTTDFDNVKYGKIIARCVRALEECVCRFPQHHKSLFRLAYSYRHFLQDYKTAKIYFLGTITREKKKINGLFADRKSNNFFNGVYRNPIDDIDRVGSFMYHMSQAMALLIPILAELNDYQMLNELAIHLKKTPDSDKLYLTSPDQEEYATQAKRAYDRAFKAYCTSLHTCMNTSLSDLLISFYQDYYRLQRLGITCNLVTNNLLAAYKFHYGVSSGNKSVIPDINSAKNYFSLIDHLKSPCNDGVKDDEPESHEATLLAAGIVPVDSFEVLSEIKRLKTELQRNGTLDNVEFMTKMPAEKLLNDDALFAQIFSKLIDDALMKRFVPRPAHRMNNDEVTEMPRLVKKPRPNIVKPPPKQAKQALVAQRSAAAVIQPRAPIEVVESHSRFMEKPPPPPLQKKVEKQKNTDICKIILPKARSNQLKVANVPGINTSPFAQLKVPTSTFNPVRLHPINALPKLTPCPPQAHSQRSVIRPQYSGIDVIDLTKKSPEKPVLPPPPKRPKLLPSLQHRPSMFKPIPPMIPVLSGTPAAYSPSVISNPIPKPKPAYVPPTSSATFSLPPKKKHLLLNPEKPAPETTDINKPSSSKFKDGWKLWNGEM